MSKCLTLIWGLPGVGKSTLWDAIENADSEIVHCDYDKAYNAIIQNPRALSQIWRDFIPEKHRLPFLIWNTEQVVKVILDNNLVSWLFQWAVFLWSIGLLKHMQETKKAIFWIISIDGTTNFSRSIVKKQANMEGFDNINFIELTASKQELIQTARKRQGIEISDIFLLNPITLKLNERQIKERIQRYKPYQESEKTFTRHITVARKDVTTIEGIKRIANWIKKS